MNSSDQELDRLDQLLSALPKENLPMTLSELDGYVTGILLCPDIIAPSEWLSNVWGETGDANFPDIPTAEATISAVMKHYNSVAMLLTQTPWIEPIYEVDPNSDETLWEAWINGFACALRLRPDEWTTVLERGDEETQSSLIFLMSLQEINVGISKFTEEEIDEIDIEAPDIIPNCVATILLMSRTELAQRIKPMDYTPSQRKRLGRNDPCPCGSERKYKKCCGSN
ncbi:UPF0149 family protein [Sulfitobacter pseudonitzschiae]|uniref:UPF0149 family protein n=1 Tax=Pseudosulfitobacter pseudonitzschiae TaxID=1402135 RepID=A0A9Q2NS55_9RHOB|nr:UPF0149 family protein [Pseudosulfitobacter pseudonitzschiae]MBM2294121.1 UPF0149 family protein [Pseudosulfitobacter pseudonitzschiae]MBM2299045.1 UPF0149 family protein [Pseudosulfitobacter pseudonitzschiae]MBM2303953.1 UPF0149 family protein [Pseudosulfitobacter pseudonitzschiae]MBM2313734.1 UPF0149 family protein [Pseudosulfitobacter pseudonitzschiae]MBM2318649.1 UPF0149 family protein [Pseudosulfitobacter pseudonitzschiae]